MNDTWYRAAEQIVVSTIQHERQVLGITAVQCQSGVSTLARGMSEIFARSGMRTLLVDLTRPLSNVGSDGQLLAGSEQTSVRFRDQRGFDCVIAQSSGLSQGAFNNVPKVRETLRQELAEYDQLILDLPSIHDVASGQVNPVAAAAACDAVLLVWPRPKATRTQIESTVLLLREGGVKLAGAVISDQNFTTAGSEMAAACRRLCKPFPGVGRWLEERILGSKFFN